MLLVIAPAKQKVNMSACIVFNTSMCVQSVSEKACVLGGRNKNQFKSIYREMTYLSKLLQSVPFLLLKAREFTRLLIEIIATGRTWPTPSEELLFGKWVNHWFTAGNHQGESMANERVEMENGLVQQDIQLSLHSFIDRPRCPAIFKLLVKWRPVALRGSLFLRLRKVQMESTLEWAQLCEKKVLKKL